MRPELIVSGIGVCSPIGVGRDAFCEGLLRGAHAFRVMQRPGRQKNSSYLGAELGELEKPPKISPRTWRSASFPAQVALATLQEAWHDAKLCDVDPLRIGLLVGGSNFQQREVVQTHDTYAERFEFLRPTYGLSFMDTDLCGICTAEFGVRGLACTIGGASASGQLAIIHAIQVVLSGQLDACIALGPLMDLSYWECQGLRSLGAMGSDRYADAPEAACRPFDGDRDGFIFGEACGAVVIEKARSSRRRATRAYARLCGWGVTMDGNRNPDPSAAGEIAAIRTALKIAKCEPKSIDYVNPHGSGSVLGDQVELEVIRGCDLAHAPLNATKSLIGHGLTAAGTVEVIATLLQMDAGSLHPSRNLDKPLDPALNWVRERAVRHSIENALTLSFGFGGINTALCLRRCH